MIYQILYPSKRMMGDEDPQTFEAAYTTDMHRVSEALKIKDVIVFSLSNLTEIEEIKVTYEEVTKETE